MNADAVERARVSRLEADLAFVRQDAAGCEKAFDAMNVPARSPGGDLLRPTGRANELLTRYRALYTLAAEMVEELERDEMLVGGEDVAKLRADVEALAPEAP